MGTQDYRISTGASNLQFSSRKLLGVALDDKVEIYKDCCMKAAEYPYLKHSVFRTVSDLKFVPFEDVMGIGHGAGFTSILVPGSNLLWFYLFILECKCNGNVNNVHISIPTSTNLGAGQSSYDTYEVNPYQTKSQRREAEVRQLLEKVRPELITLDPERIGEVNATAAAEGALDRAKKISLKPSAVTEFEARERTKGRGGTAKRYHVKKTLKNEERMREIKQQLSEAASVPREGRSRRKKNPKKILDRLK